MSGDACSVTDSAQLREELSRRARIADQMLSAHALLGDRYARRARFVDLITLGVSTVLCALTFVDPQILAAAGVSEPSARIIIGICATLVFFLSIAQLRLDWKDRGGRHEQACATLADLKVKARDLLASTDEELIEKGTSFLRAYASSMGTLIPIPDNQFVALKAHHRMKVEMSRRLDRHPTAPVWAIRLALRVHGIASLFSRDTPKA
jgi:hypothetical protein